SGDAQRATCTRKRAAACLRTGDGVSDGLDLSATTGRGAELDCDVAFIPTCRVRGWEGHSRRNWRLAVDSAAIDGSDGEAIVRITGDVLNRRHDRTSGTTAWR